MENHNLFIPFPPKLAQTSSIGTVHRSQVERTILYTVN